MLINLWVRDKASGVIHQVGTDVHDSIIGLDNGTPTYYNLQNGGGTSDEYEWVEAPNLDDYISVTPDELRLNRELIHKLEIELKAMRGAANSYKAEVERRQSEYEKVRESGIRWMNKCKELQAEIEMLKEVTTNTINTSIEFGLDKEKQINKAKSEAIKEFAAELYNSFRQYENYDRHHTFEILDRIESVENFLLNNLVKEMTE